VKIVVRFHLNFIVYQKITIFAPTTDLANNTMGKNTISLYERTFKRFVLSSLILVTVSLVLGGSSYFGTYPINYFLAVLVFLLVFSSAIVYITPIIYVKKLIKFYFLFLVVALFPVTVFYLAKGIATVIFWYFPIPVFIYAVYSHRKAIRWSLLCFGVMVLAFVLSYLVRDSISSDPIVHLSFKNLFFSDLIHASSAFLMIYLCLYYLHKFHQYRISEFLDSVDGEGYDDAEKIDNLLSKGNGEEQKYEQIYMQIEEYFRNKQPYLDPEFKMMQMAYELNINALYLAKAIRLKKNMNFNNFVNDYRIEKVKEMIESDSRKYTLKYIYLSSGFKNQSSFNKIFKLKEGITPSEYYKQNRPDKED